MRRRPTFPLYTGGFLGPFGGAMLVALIPNIADGLDTTVGLVAAAITAYMVPFAALQLVSGTIAERVGGGRVVRAGYVAFGVAALLCAFAPEIWTFIAARALMGTANAFLSPILLAALSEAAPPAALGRAVGTFAAVQTAGLTMAPVLGGALGELSWRLAFVLVAAVSFVLAMPRLELHGSAARTGERATMRTLLNRWIGLIATTALAMPRDCWRSWASNWSRSVAFHWSVLFNTSSSGLPKSASQRSSSTWPRVRSPAHR